MILTIQFTNSLGVDKGPRPLMLNPYAYRGPYSQRLWDRSHGGVELSDKNTLLIESGRATTTMQVENAKDYISMPDVNREFSIAISKAALKNMIRQCIFATAQDDSKPILRGVLIELADRLTKGEFVKVQGKMAKFDSGDNYVMIADSIRSLWRPGMPKKFDIDELSKLQ